MGFTSETAREAGRKSKRGKDKFSEEIKELLQLKADILIQELDIRNLTSNQKIKVLSIILPYIISKPNSTKLEGQIDLPLFIE
jgi:hypothetical protein